jgi:hypothetical protein
MLKVSISINSLNFYWGEKGYKWECGTPIECCWEDVYYKVYREGELIREGGTTVETRRLIESELENLDGDLGAKMELQFPGYIEEEKNSTHYGIPYKDLPLCNELKWGFSYEEPDCEDFYQIEDLINLPKNEDGVYPSYISCYIPVGVLDRSSIELSMKSYIKLFMGFDEDIEFTWEEVPTDEYLETEYKSTLEEIENWNKHKKDGEPTKVMLLPQPLAMFLGKEKVDELVARGLENAEILTDSQEFLLHFKDGTTELSGSQIDPEDHFSDAEDIF